MAKGLLGLLDHHFGKRKRDLDRLRPHVAKVRSAAEQLRNVPDEELVGMRAVFRERHAAGESLDDLLPEAFGVVWEGCRRLAERRASWLVWGHEQTWDMVPYDVQIIGAVALHEGKIAEMATGEGKTLVAIMPLYLNSLPGKGAHLVTVNDYLARRDAEWMGGVLKFLGCNVAFITHDMSPDQRREAYGADDHLRHQQRIRLRLPARQHVRAPVAAGAARVPLRDRRRGRLGAHRRGAHAADHQRRRRQVDAPLQRTAAAREEARRPADEDRHQLDRRLSSAPCKKAEDGENVEIDDETRAQAPAHQPRRAQEQALPPPGAASPACWRWSSAPRKRTCATRRCGRPTRTCSTSWRRSTTTSTSPRRAASRSPPDEHDFFVLPDLAEAASARSRATPRSTPRSARRSWRRSSTSTPARTSRSATSTSSCAPTPSTRRTTSTSIQEGKIVIVDEFTGRLMPGRRYSEGLHQALEAKEGVVVEKETQTLATVTIQNFFRMYEKLAGMTGTAETEEAEFHSIYKLDVVVIPTNRPVARTEYNDVIYLTKKEKYKAIVDEVARLHAPRPARPGRHDDGRGLGAAQPPAHHAPHQPQRAQRQAPPARGRDRRRGRPRRRGDHRHEHGRPRHRHQARPGHQDPARALAERRESQARGLRRTRRSACTSSAPNATRAAASTASCAAAPAARATPAPPCSSCPSRTTSCGSSAPTA